MILKKRKLLFYSGISAGVLLLIIAGAVLFYFIRMSLETGKMSAVDSGEVVNGVYAIKDENYINFYLIKSGDTLIAIDSGQNQNNVRDQLNKLNLDPFRVAAVFLTHTDPDHVGGLVLFPNARAYLSQEEEQMINGNKPRFFIVPNSLPTRYEVLADNQTVQVSDFRVTCILTPGHTPGSMSYLINDTYLFVGDTMSLINNKVYLFNDFFNMDTNKQKSSIAKISKLPKVKYIFTAHYGYSENNPGLFSDFIR